MTAREERVDKEKKMNDRKMSGERNAIMKRSNKEMRWREM